MDTDITVETKTELEEAKESGYKQITVRGKLADDLKKTKKIAYAGAATITLLVAAIAAIPFTGGLSTMGAIPIAALTGLEISGIILAASVGITLIVAVFKDYEEISYSEGKLVLKKKQ